MNRGYLLITIGTRGKNEKTFLLHRLVAKTFLPNPNNLPEVNHKNTIKTDCSLSNLEWCT